jgi:hypothetical protein
MLNNSDSKHHIVIDFMEHQRWDARSLELSHELLLHDLPLVFFETTCLREVALVRKINVSESTKGSLDSSRLKKQTFVHIRNR